MFKVFPASLQAFIDTPNCVREDRVQYTNYVITVSDKLFKIFFVFLWCNHQVNRDFLIALYYAVQPYLSDSRGQKGQEHSSVYVKEVDIRMCTISWFFAVSLTV
jgi:hypothetical protein